MFDSFVFSQFAKTHFQQFCRCIFRSLFRLFPSFFVFVCCSLFRVSFINFCFALVWSFSMVLGSLSCKYNEMIGRFELNAERCKRYEVHPSKHSLGPFFAFLPLHVLCVFFCFFFFAYVRHLGCVLLLHVPCCALEG